MSILFIALLMPFASPDENQMRAIEVVEEYRVATERWEELPSRERRKTRRPKLVPPVFGRDFTNRWGVLDVVSIYSIGDGQSIVMTKMLAAADDGRLGYYRVPFVVDYEFKSKRHRPKLIVELGGAWPDLDTYQPSGAARVIDGEPIMHRARLIAAKGGK